MSAHALPELFANALALDFVNTVNKRPDRDLLASADGFLTWVAAALPHATLARGDIDNDLLAMAVDLRDAVHAVFEAVVEGDALPRRDVRHLLAVHARGVARGRMVVDGDTAHLEWPSTQPVHVLWAVADSAVWLLVSGPLRRIGRCRSCRRLFLDTSRNGTRRWCSMATCGSRSKARRSYHRRAGE